MARSICCAARSPRRSREGLRSPFSIAIFPGGIGALLRADAPARLREVLAGRPAETGPLWRGTVDTALNAGKFSAVAGTTGEKWLAGKVNEFQITSQVTPVPSYDAGVQRVLDRGSNALFGDRVRCCWTPRGAVRHRGT